MTAIWSAADRVAHFLHLPGHWICDHYDRALGLSDDELNRRLP